MMFAASAALTAAGIALGGTAGKIIRLAGTAAVAIDMLMAARCLLTRFEYEIEEAETGRIDLTVTEIRGRRERIVCRAALQGAGLLTSAEGLPRPHGRVYDFTPGFPDKEAVYLLLSETDGGGIAKLLPDEAMLSVMKRFCGE